MKPVLRWFRFVALASCIAVTACCKLPKSGDKDSPLPPAAAGEKAFDVNATCSNDPDLIIRRIVLAPKETRVHLQKRNTTSNNHEISTSPPGQADTFFLEAADQHRHVQLLRSSGIAVSPAKQTIEPGNKVDFVLYFPPIDESWSPVDLHEGEILKKGTTYWNFIDVPLK